MKKYSIPITVLSLVLALCLSFSVFAATAPAPRYAVGRFDYWNTMMPAPSSLPDPLLINVWGTDIANGRRVTLYAGNPGDQNQLFSVQQHPTDGSYRMYVRNQYNISTRRGYTLNRAPSNTCTVWADQASNRGDSEIDIRTIGILEYYITLANSNLFLTAGGNTNGSDLYWGGYTANLNQKWHNSGMD